MVRRLRLSLSSSQRRARGQMLILMTLAFLLLIFFIGSGIDYGMVLVEEQKIQNAIDTAALAGARGMVYAPVPGPTAARATAAAFLSLQGYVDGVNNTTVSYAFTTPTPRPSQTPTGQLDSMRVSVRRDKPTFFWRLFGLNSVTLNRSAVGAPGGGNYDVAVVVDLTQSMLTDDNPDGCCTLPALRTFVAELARGLQMDPNNPLSNRMALASFQGQECGNSNGVLAFGYNASGQLGDSSTTDRWNPVTSDPAGSVRVAAGGSHSVSYVASGTNRLRAWGLNDHQQVNTSGTAFFNNQQTIGSGAPNQIAAGGYHSLALIGTSANNLYSWGRNDRGQLARNGTTDSGSVAQVNAAPFSANRAHAIAAGGMHSLGVVLPATGPRLYAWGANSSGQLGIGSTTDSIVPAAVTGVSNGTPATGSAGQYLIAAGWAHSMAVFTSDLRTLYVWGDNTYGQLGDNTTTNRSTPVTVTFSSNIVDVAAGGNHSMLLLANGQVWAWGSNANGQLGNGGAVDATPCAGVPCSRAPRQASFVLPAGAALARVFAGYNHSLALDTINQLWVWGSNGNGQLGLGTTNDQATPTVNLDAVGVTAASAGGTADGSHTLAVACTDLKLDAHLLARLTTDTASLVRAAATPAAAAACPTLDTQQPSWATTLQSNTTYICPLDAVGGSGTYHRSGIDIVFKEGQPDWNIFAFGGRATAKKVVILITDGRNNLAGHGNLPTPQTCTGANNGPLGGNYASCSGADFNSITDANRLKVGANGARETPCLLTSNPPCDDVTVFTIGIFTPGESGLVGSSPRNCGNRTAADGPQPTVPGTATNVDWELIYMSSSTGTSCDHYIPLLRQDSAAGANNLSTALQTILGRLRGQLKL